MLTRFAFASSTNAIQRLRFVRLCRTASGGEGSPAALSSASCCWAIAPPSAEPFTARSQPLVNGQPSLSAISSTTLLLESEAGGRVVPLPPSLTGTTNCDALRAAPQAHAGRLDT